MAERCQDETQVQWNLSRNSSMIKNSGEFRDFVMEYMERDAQVFEEAQSKLDNLSSYIRSEKEKLQSSMLDISREVSESKSIFDNSFQSNSPYHNHSLSPSRGSPPRSGMSTSTDKIYSENKALVHQSHTSISQAQLDTFQRNVEQSIDKAFADSLGTTEELMIKLYYTGKDPRIRSKDKEPDFEYSEEGKDASMFKGYVQDRSSIETGINEKEASMAAEELRDDADYQQLKRELLRVFREMWRRSSRRV